MILSMSISNRAGFDSNFSDSLISVHAVNCLSNVIIMIKCQKLKTGDSCLSKRSHLLTYWGTYLIKN